MTRTKVSLLTVALGIAVVAGAGVAVADGPVPSLDAPELAQGPYALMHMRLQKTILNINVATST